MNGEVRSIAQGVTIIIVLALFGFALAHAGIEKLAFSEDSVLTKYLSREGISEEQIDFLLSLQRIDEDNRLWVSGDYRMVIVFTPGQVEVIGHTATIRYTGEVLCDYTKQKR